MTGFVKQNFSVSSDHYNANLPRVHKYVSSDDDVAAMDTTGYFNAVSDEVSVGDIILVKDSAGAVANLLVVSNAAGVVDTANAVNYATTDTD